MKSPKQLTLNPAEIEALCEKISSSNFSSNEADLLIGLMNANAWMQQVLIEGRLTIKRLQKLFGVTTEKLHNHKDKAQIPPNSDENEDKETKNHGRLKVPIPRL